MPLWLRGPVALGSGCADKERFLVPLLEYLARPFKSIFLPLDINSDSRLDVAFSENRETSIGGSVMQSQVDPVAIIIVLRRKAFS